MIFFVPQLAPASQVSEKQPPPERPAPGGDAISYLIADICQPFSMGLGRGEGSMAIAVVHQYLTEIRAGRPVEAPV
jgi:hypothetical protein